MKQRGSPPRMRGTLNRDFWSFPILQSAGLWYNGLRERHPFELRILCGCPFILQRVEWFHREAHVEHFTNLIVASNSACF